MIRRVKTENGWVRGLPAADPRITSYKGIPFADKPVGANRWRAPQPCPDWEGEWFAVDFAPISMQPITALDKSNIYTREWAVDETLPMSEDCLYLNVWAPGEGQKGLPVYVWFFGGGLQVGNTAEMEFDGERIARRGIVVVTVNYRLNAFGFLAHPEITAEAPDAPANFGFLDQCFALKWVQRNIEAFGGDPGRVTIGGQSAGGMSVAAQLSHSENQGLFQRAIIQSGAFIPAYPSLFCLCQPLAEAEERGRRFFAYLGVRTLEEARAMDEQTLYRKMLSWDDPGMWTAAVDGRFLKRDPGQWYWQADRVHCPVLTGRTDDEFLLSPEAEDEASLSRLADEIPGLDREAFLACFAHPATKQSIARDGEVSAIAVATRVIASEAREPVYLYSFGAEIPGWDHPGAFHSVDLWFSFETLAKCWRPFTGAHYDLARRMCDFFCHFISAGDPNGMGTDGEMLPYWPPYTLEAPVEMRFAKRAYPVRSPEKPIEGVLRRAYVQSRKEKL